MDELTKAIQKLIDQSSTINETQTVFMVFYAIVWGAIANVQPRWKPFQWPLVFLDRRVTFRVSLSVLILTILPFAFFGITLASLGDKHYHISQWSLSSALVVVVHAVVPAIANFGFYRLWLGFIELGHDYFYNVRVQDISPAFRTNEPNVDRLWNPKKHARIDRRTWEIRIEYDQYDPGPIRRSGLRNIGWAFAYLLIAVAVNSHALWRLFIS
jgi:hypothetical protein